MARPKDANSRRSKAAAKRARKQALAGIEERGVANARVEARREAFAFVTPTKGPDGRCGTIDQDICDGIGQLHALGFLDNHGYDPQDLRDKGRAWGEGYWRCYGATAPATSKNETVSRTTGDEVRKTKADYEFEELDAAMDVAFDRGAVMSLVVDQWWSDEIVPWASGLIAEGLLKRGRYPGALVVFPVEHDRHLMAACVRGLCKLVEATIPARHQKIAA